MTRFALVFALSLAACGGSSQSGPPPAGPASSAEPTPVEPAATEAASAGGARCVAGDTPPAPLTPDEAELQGLAKMREMGDVFERNAGDCKALAAGIRAWVAENCTLLLRFKAFADTQTEEQKAEFDRKHNDEMMAIGTKMMPAMQNCGNDADVAAAMDELPQ
jgi:hypothetical protein